MSPTTVTAIGLTCKAFLNCGLSTITVNGLSTLTEALHNDKRNNGQGVVTVSNHISTLDDPLTWGVLPASWYLKPRMTRWTLGASDIMFTNPILSHFFRQGQVLETFRGKGIFQDALNTAIQKLDQGAWIHLYGEGKVNQSKTYKTDREGRVVLPRFKWGVGHIISSTTNVPTVIPMWLTGFDSLMPEGRPFPFKYCPRIGARLSVTFGDPIASEDIKRTIDAARSTGAEAQIRKDVTSLIHGAVQDLGRKLS